MKLLLTSLTCLLLSTNALKAQYSPFDVDQDSIFLLKLSKKYSTVISYKIQSFGIPSSRCTLVRKKNSWARIYWVKKTNKKKTPLGKFYYKEKKQRFPTTKGDSIFNTFTQEKFSTLNTDSLNTRMAPGDSTYIGLSHCSSESIYFYHHKTAVTKDAYCILFYYPKAPNQHKARFIKLGDQFYDLIKETLDKKNLY